MMTAKAKEKAKYLINEFYSKVDEERLLVNKYWSNAKFCALIAVDEILDSSMAYFDDNSDYVNYWQQVKQEIKIL